MRLSTVGLVVLLSAAAPPDDPTFPSGIVVEDVIPGSASYVAGLKAGDVVLAWKRDPSGPADPGSPEKPVRSPLDVTDIEWEQLPRGPILLRILRAGEPITFTAPMEANGLVITARPNFPPPLLALYDRGQTLSAAGKLEEADVIWRETAEGSAGLQGGVAARCWMLNRIGSQWAAKDVEKSRAAFRESITCAEKLGPLPLAAVFDEQAAVEGGRGHLKEAAEAFQAGLRVRAEAGLAPLARVRRLWELANVVERLGEIDRAMALFVEATTLAERETPDGLALSTALTLRGGAVERRGRWEEREELCDRAAAIAERAGPETPTICLALTCQAGALLLRGDRVTAERLFQRAHEISIRWGSNGVVSHINLGAVAHARGDIESAEEHYRASLAVVERVNGPDARNNTRAILLVNLGTAAADRGDLPAAEDLFRRSLAIFEEVGASYNAAIARRSLGEALAARGNAAAAREAMEKSLAHAEARFPNGGETTAILTSLGDLEASLGSWEAAERDYERAQAIQERLDRSTLAYARVLRGLGAVRRARHQLGEAASLFGRATDILEMERSRPGGSEEARALFTSTFFGIYHDWIESLVALNRTREAFEVLERSRARSLRNLMAQRDLVLKDVPAPLDRELRRADADYERLRADLDNLDGQKDTAKIAELGVRLGELRQKQAEILEKIRLASPRLADFRDPQPLDEAAVRAGLEPGTLLLVYSVGKDTTVLFVVSADGVRAVAIPVGHRGLRPRIEAWRRMVEKTAPPADFFAEAEKLYDLLIGPAEPEIGRARRIVLCPDGPLHQLPFGALRRGRSYLVEEKRLVIVPSGTILAQLSRSRSTSSGAQDLLAFGDPLHPDSRLAALAGSRREVEDLRRIFPRSTAFLGPEATEDKVKALGKGARYVHFACHALVNEGLPLESALALTPSADGAGTFDNGLLHAWEIFERVRLDADLVTLSACRSAAGPELAGEGLVGLTRAFAYAGARSVLASLWSVGDTSTASFMARFYGSLKQGMAKDEALRRAQVAAIRAGQHPVRWAAFQLYGDWR